MLRLTACVLALGLCSTAFADKKPAAPPATLPKVGDVIAEHGGADWPAKVTWLYDAPSAKDAAGRVIVYWFCAPKIAACTDDLARLVTLRDTGHVYIVAYINGTQRDAKKLDPIRESEGVGKGTVGYGPAVTTMMKQMAVTGPESIVVDVDGKVSQIITDSDANALDGRDAKINALAAAIKDYVSSHDGPGTPKPNDKFTLTFKVQLSSWLSFSTTQAATFDLTAPKDIKCDSKSLKGDQLKVDGKTMTATVSCSAPKGIYEAQGKIRFGYNSPNGAGFGDDGATWKFEVK